MSQFIKDIKLGEIWRIEHTKIYLNNEGDLIILDNNYIKNNDVNILQNLIALNLKSEYWLEN